MKLLLCYFQLVKLPRSPNVDDILKKYLEYRTKKDGTLVFWTIQFNLRISLYQSCSNFILSFVCAHRINESVSEILKGLRCYFDKALPVLLLYSKEKSQYNEIVDEGVSPSTIYGAEHLLRLFGKSKF